MDSSPALASAESCNTWQGTQAALQHANKAICCCTTWGRKQTSAGPRLLTSRSSFNAGAVLSCVAAPPPSSCASCALFVGLQRTRHMGSRRAGRWGVMPSSASQAQLRRSCPALQASPSSQECSSAAIAPTSRPRFPCTHSCSAPTSVRNLAAATCWDVEQCLICHCWSTAHALTVPLGLLQVGHRLCTRLTHIVASPDDHVGQAQALAGALQSQASAQVLSAQPANPSSPAARVQLLHWDMLHKGMPRSTDAADSCTAALPPQPCAHPREAWPSGSEV